MIEKVSSMTTTSKTSMSYTISTTAEALELMDPVAADENETVCVPVSILMRLLLGLSRCDKKNLRG